MGNRKEATAELLKWVDKILPGSPNAALYKKRLEAMTDREFEAFIVRLENEEEYVSLIAPNLSSPKLSVERNLKIAEELGHKFFQRLWLTDPATGTEYLTPVPYLVVDLPIRRQQQLLVKKISIPEDNRHVDELTGQPSGPSKGSKVSFPETQVLYAQGMNRSIEELIKFRGGDIKAFQAMNRQIVETGGASMDSIKRTPTRVKSTETLGTFLKAMHLDNNV